MLGIREVIHFYSSPGHLGLIITEAVGWHFGLWLVEVA